ncbi:MAG TPA: DUF1566 domain-containing protein [Polyangia bacterium]
MKRRPVSLSLLGLTLVGFGCGGSTSTGQGGSSGSSGASGSNGDGRSGGSGGASPTGGATGQGESGGAPATGGATGQGGSSGTAATGGATATGGAKASGGTPGSGGTTGSGGAMASGGATGQGGAAGATASGGAKGTGGATGQGGSSGGATGQGGVSGATGGCVPATCGSHKWACWHMPNPASASGLPNPASYTDLGNGAVRDNVTCLDWEKAPGTTQGYWQDNSDHCASLASSSYAGFSDWRLPTRVEMASIVDFARTGDAIDTTAFPKEPSGYYRTGSDWYETISGQNSSGFSWIYGMSSGFTSNAYAKTTSMAYVRCVRGNGSGEAQGTFAVPPPSQYTAANGEVTDNYTGLIWQQTDSATPSGAAVLPWSAAAGTCANLGLNGHTWRVPTINELATLVDEARVGPAINKTMFPNTKYGSYSNNWYWASTTYGTGSYGWAINFDDGFTGYNSGSATGKNGSPEWNYFTGAWVRCVR